MLEKKTKQNKTFVLLNHCLFFVSLFYILQGVVSTYNFIYPHKIKTEQKIKQLNEYKHSVIRTYTDKRNKKIYM